MRSGRVIGLARTPANLSELRQAYGHFRGEIRAMSNQKIRGLLSPNSNLDKTRRSMYTVALFAEARRRGIRVPSGRVTVASMTKQYLAATRRMRQCQASEPADEPYISWLAEWD